MGSGIRKVRKVITSKRTTTRCLDRGDD